MPASPGSVNGFRLLEKSGIPVSCGAVVTEEILATIRVPANLLGANGELRIFITWQMTSSVNAKTMRVRFSGVAGGIFQQTTLTASQSNATLCQISNQNDTMIQTGGASVTAAGGWSGSANPPLAGAVDTTQDTDIVLTGQKVDAADTLTLVRYLVEFIPIQ